MAKAADDTTTWIPAWAALTLLDKVYGTELAKKLLLRWLGEGRVRWTCERLEGRTQQEYEELRQIILTLPPYSKGDRYFFLNDPEVHWEQVVWAHERNSNTLAVGIMVSREDLQKLVPITDVATQAQRPEITSASVNWSIAAARRLKGANKIREGMTKADVARLLEAEMQKAAKAGEVHRALKASYIENQLESWGIWPISSIE